MYIIKVLVKIEGKCVDAYHQKIRRSKKRMKVINVYSECLTTKRKKAMVFYDFDEAYGVNSAFERSERIGEIVKITNKKKRK